MDLEIREFKNAIVQFVNKSELPMEVKRLCLKEILDEVNILSDETIKAQIVLRNSKENDNNLEERDDEDAEIIHPD